MGIHIPIEPGTRFGKWVVLDRTVSPNGRTDAFYLCECDCGFVRTLASHDLRHGKTTQCFACANRQKLKLAVPARKGKLKYNQKSLEPAIKTLFSGYIGSAKRRDFIFDLSYEQFIDITSMNCHYCGIEPSQVHKYRTYPSYRYNGIDRVDSQIGYISSNCVPCCKICNYAKMDMPYREWEGYIKRLTQHQTRKTRKQHTPHSGPYQRSMEFN
jgi:hypothetical protein